MNSEQDIIRLFIAEMPRAKGHMHSFFESDAEVIAFEGSKFLFSMDEFSAEDLFGETDPFILGWNLATCTISDVLATGGKPAYFGHSVTLSKNWSKDYIIRFARGIGAVLQTAGAGFIGGDLGLSENWKYTGVCLGTADDPVTRKGAEEGDSIYMTGCIGLGNLQAAVQLNSENQPLLDMLKEVSSQFALRLHESEVMAPYASACIDSSDGILNALNTLANLNGLGFRIANLPLIPEGIAACKLLDLPETLLAIGECGEYELVLTIPESRENDFLASARKFKLAFHKIGKMVQKPLKILEEADFYCTFNDFNISARSYEEPASYLMDLAKYLAHARKDR